MTQSPTSSSSAGTSSSAASGALAQAAPSPLQTEQGKTTVADGVVQKIAGLAAREVSGVYDLGGGAARAFGALRERIPGATQSAGQGVSVEVGEKQAAVDLDIVTEYGAPIAEVSKSVRRNVISTVEGMTGLQVTEVNIAVNDVHLPSDDEGQQEPARVQ
ncbi:Asp23/Gls24 family envelope stress response protein [Blastococcus sp. CCUG 61487]|uniref:Asp23/Gls24 family envelope stress response protein n=1 Tax=Blastococcus sp. CCUG 61487 TaxID=1840703 RepID=UPI0010C13D3B|nr:Asp23/Gls24 family envelope stress response protein [Blastococcus sp. CCUG 61487]TKJ16846.1 stress protein, Gls24 family [Blastococcus sp. CCUG 61487]